MITVNGTTEELAPGATLHDVLERRGAVREGVAVAVDGEVVPRRLWRETALRDGTSVEVLTAVQGG